MPFIDRPLRRVFMLSKNKQNAHLLITIPAVIGSLNFDAKRLAMRNLSIISLKHCPRHVEHSEDSVHVAAVRKPIVKVP